MSFSNDLEKSISVQAAELAKKVAHQAVTEAMSVIRQALVPAPVKPKAKPGPKPKAKAVEAAPVGSFTTVAPVQAEAPIDHSPKTVTEEAKDSGIVKKKKPGRAKMQPAFCSVEVCGKPTLAKGLCSNHYRAARAAAKKKADANGTVAAQPAA